MCCILNVLIHQQYQTGKISVRCFTVCKSCLLPCLRNKLKLEVCFVQGGYKISWNYLCYKEQDKSFTVNPKPLCKTQGKIVFGRKKRTQDQVTLNASLELKVLTQSVPIACGDIMGNCEKKLSEVWFNYVDFLAKRRDENPLRRFGNYRLFIYSFNSDCIFNLFKISSKYIFLKISGVVLKMVATTTSDVSNHRRRSAPRLPLVQAGI